MMRRCLLACLVVLVLAQTASAAITLQDFTHCTAASVSTLDCVLDTNPDAGNILVAAAGQSSTGASVATGVSGGCDVAWTLIPDSSSTTGFNSRISAWICTDATGGATTVTPTWTGSATVVRLGVWELSFDAGYDATPGDAAVAGYGATTATIAHGEVTTGAGTWIILTAMIATGAFGVTTPIASHDVDVSGDRGYMTHRIGSGITTTNPTLVLDTSPSAGAFTVALHETTAVGCGSHRTLTGAGC